MLIDYLSPGDIVFAASDIHNDGSLPGHDASQLIASQGSRGVIINTGHLEDQPQRQLVLVRFENGAPGELGPAVACWPEELQVAEIEAH